MSSKDRTYDCLIVGAGPAGLFAALELIKLGSKKIIIVDRGKSAKKREFTETLCGVGGAGLFSDGKLNFASRIGKTDLSEFITNSESETIIDEIEKTFLRFGVKEKTYPTNLKEAEQLRRKIKKLGMDLLLIRQKHLGSDKLPVYINRIENFLKRKKVKFLLENEVTRLLTKGKKIKGVRLNGGKEIIAEKVIVAPGRVGNSWLVNELHSLGVDLEQKGIEIGVRVEVPEEVMADLTSIIYDPTIFIRTSSYDDEIRTFCTNPVGFVVQEEYLDFACVNGHANKNHTSANSNFALLDKVSLTEPVTDTIAYGESICRLAMTLGGGKPILQRLADFKRRRRSTWSRLRKSYVEPTLKEVTPGDISMAFPHRIVVNLIEALEALEKVIPGVFSDSTLLYAPEAKFFSVRPKVEKNLQTEIKGLFVAGDGAGVSGNIVGAAATGIIAARGMIAKL